MAKKENRQAVRVHEYLDFREYLNEVLASLRRNGAPVTNRSFAEAVGIRSSSWLTGVLGGTKGLSGKTVDAISSCLHHTPWERDYFKMLVRFNQAKKVELRSALFADLKHHLVKKGYHATRILEPDQYEFYSRWYYTAVRSLLGMVPMGDEYSRIARLTSPSITAAQAKKSVKLLTKLGLVKKTEKGHHELTGTAIATGNNIKSLAVAKFQRDTMRLGSEAIDRYPATERDISTMSIGISRESLVKITKLLATCRSTVAEIANNDPRADQVYQLNLQLFPLSKNPAGREV